MCVCVCDIIYYYYYFFYVFISVMQIRIFISLYASLQCHIILQKSFQYVDLLSMLFFLAFYSSKTPEQNVTGSKKYSAAKRLGYVCNPRSLKEGTETSRRVTDELGSRLERPIHFECN